MKKDSTIREAIDESLCSVRFNAQDERAVLSAVHGRRVKAKKRARRLNFVYAMSLLLLLAVPVTAFTLRARRLNTAAITAAPGEDIILSPDSTPLVTAAPDASAAPDATDALTEQQAIQAARACFESVCDTSIFSFDEYTVSCERQGDSYFVLMTSIYGNGCTFSATIDALTGEALHHSPARLATQPASTAVKSDAAKTWVERFGSNLFTWPAADQIEYARRYKGAILREAKDGEITREQAQTIAKTAAEADYAAQGLSAIEPLCYPMLFAERAFDDGTARYWVVCRPDRPADGNAETFKTAPDVFVMLNAQTGQVENVKHELSSKEMEMLNVE